MAVLDSEAEQELLDAAAWYDRRRAALGERFVDEVLEVGRTIDAHPEAGRLLVPRADGEPVRQFPLKSFPYVLVYLPQQRPILIVAVAHTRRMPQYWAERVSNSDDQDP